MVCAFSHIPVKTHLQKVIVAVLKVADLKMSLLFFA